MKIGWFTSGGGKQSRNLLMAVQTAIRRKELDAEIEFVFCTRGPGESLESNLFLRLVNTYNLPFICISYREHKQKYGSKKIVKGALPDWRLEYDRLLMHAIEPFHPDVCVLAGYKLITGPELCLKFSMVNLHPAAPRGPAGTWQEVIGALIDNNAHESGVMMHLVTPELDKGPPVTYCTFAFRGGIFDTLLDKNNLKSASARAKEPVENNPLFRAIRDQGLKREIPLVLTTLKAISQGKINISPQGKVLDNRGKPSDGYDLTDEVDRLI